MKFWVMIELFVMPTPLIVSVNDGVAVMVKALGPVLKTMPATCVFAESERAVVVEEPKVATSAAPLGDVPGDQLPAVFQLPVAGFAAHVALPAKVGLTDNSRSRERTLKAETGNLREGCDLRPRKFTR